MKNFVCALAIALFSSSSTLAADNIEFDSERFDWGGSYLGIGIGHADFGITDVTFGGGDPNPEGLTGSLVAGYNVQQDNFIFGLEIDGTVGDVEGSNAATFGFLQPADLEYMASIRGRLGIANDTFHLFGTAGYGIAEFSFEHDAFPTPGSNVSEQFTGLVYGGGIEMAVSEHIFIRAEYLRFDLDNEVAGFFGGTDPHVISIDNADLFRFVISRSLN